jgi:hypothetical protein
MVIENKKKKTKKRVESERVVEQEGKEEKVKEEIVRKKVRFDLSQNKITEFFKHGKVAQRLLYQTE